MLRDGCARGCPFAAEFLLEELNIRAIGNIEKESWETKHAFNLRRNIHISLSIGMHIYIFSGCINSNIFSSAH